MHPGTSNPGQFKVKLTNLNQPRKTMKPKPTVRVWLSHSHDPSRCRIFGRWADISDDYMDGETPLEDYPYWLTTPDPISEKEAFKRWNKILADREG